MTEMATVKVKAVNPLQSRCTVTATCDKWATYDMHLPESKEAVKSYYSCREHAHYVLNAALTEVVTQ